LFSAGYSGGYWINNIREVLIGENVTTIGSNAFLGYDKVEKINIPANVINIGDGENSSSIFPPFSNIQIVEWHCSYIPSSTFVYHGLKQLILGDEVKTIKKQAFKYCDNLTSIILPEGIKEIGAEAFFRCKSLKTVTSYIREPFSIESDDIFSDWAFDECPADTLYVPAGTRKLYRKVGGWNKFKNIIEMGGGAPVPFELSASEASVVAGVADYKVEITSGNDSYTVSSSDESVATAKIEESDGKTYVVITALKAGKATITVTDEESSEKKEIQVEVHTPGELYMIVNHQNSPVEIGLSGHPHVTYTGNQLKIQTPDRTYSFSVNEVNGISFGKKTTNQ
jgi:hypothetical protein